MAMGGGSSGGIKSDINVTPLVDVVLVLLIIFMVITPMLQRGKDVQLPRASHVEKNKKASDPVIVSITTEHKIYIESEAFDDRAFEANLRVKLAETPGRKILLKGDTALNFEDVRRVMNLARKAGAKGMALGVEELKH
jgi:biopolymer transport protein TolR